MINLNPALWGTWLGVTCQYISLIIVLFVSCFFYCRTTSAATLLSQETVVQICISPSRHFHKYILPPTNALYYPWILSTASKGCTESGKKHIMYEMLFGVISTSLSLIQCWIISLVGKVELYLTPYSVWFLVEHRKIFALLFVASSSI